MENRGYFKLYRNIDEKAFYYKPKYLAIWIELNKSAKFQPGEIIYNNESIKLKPGDVLTSQKRLSEIFRISLSTVNRILKHFKSENLIEIQTNNSFSLISITNWIQDQTDGNPKRKRVESEEKARRKPAETYNNEYKEENEENEKNFLGEKNFLNLSLENQIQSYFETERQLNGHALDETNRFIDYYTRKGIKLDNWQTLIKNWQCQCYETNVVYLDRSEYGDVIYNKTLNQEFSIVVGAGYKRVIKTANNKLIGTDGVQYELR